MFFGEFQSVSFRVIFQFYRLENSLCSAKFILILPRFHFVSYYEHDAQIKNDMILHTIWIFIILSTCPTEAAQTDSNSLVRIKSRGIENEKWEFKSINFKANAGTALLIKCDKRMYVQCERIGFFIAFRCNERVHSFLIFPNSLSLSHTFSRSLSLAQVWINAFTMVLAQ